MRTLNFYHLPRLLFTVPLFSAFLLGCEVKVEIHSEPATSALKHGDTVQYPGAEKVINGISVPQYLAFYNVVTETFEACVLPATTPLIVMGQKDGTSILTIMPGVSVTGKPDMSTTVCREGSMPSAHSSDVLEWRNDFLKAHPSKQQDRGKEGVGT